MAELGHFRPGRACPRQRCGVYFGEVRAAPGVHEAGKHMGTDGEWETVSEAGKALKID